MIQSKEMKKVLNAAIVLMLVGQFVHGPVSAAGEPNELQYIGLSDARLGRLNSCVQALDARLLVNSKTITSLVPSARFAELASWLRKVNAASKTPSRLVTARATNVVANTVVAQLKLTLNNSALGMIEDLKKSIQSPGVAIQNMVSRAVTADGKIVLALTLIATTDKLAQKLEQLIDGQGGLLTDRRFISSAEIDIVGLSPDIDPIVVPGIQEPEFLTVRSQTAEEWIADLGESINERPSGAGSNEKVTLSGKAILDVASRNMIFMLPSLANRFFDQNEMMKVDHLVSKNGRGQRNIDGLLGEVANNNQIVFVTKEFGGYLLVGADDYAKWSERVEAELAAIKNGFGSKSDADLFMLVHLCQNCVLPETVALDSSVDQMLVPTSAPVTRAAMNSGPIASSAQSPVPSRAMVNSNSTGQEDKPAESRRGRGGRSGINADSPEGKQLLEFIKQDGSLDLIYQHIKDLGLSGKMRLHNFFYFLAALAVNGDRALEAELVNAVNSGLYETDQFFLGTANSRASLSPAQLRALTLLRQVGIYANKARNQSDQFEINFESVNSLKRFFDVLGVMNVSNRLLLSDRTGAPSSRTTPTSELIEFGKEGGAIDLVIELIDSAEIQGSNQLQTFLFQIAKLATPSNSENQKILLNELKNINFGTTDLKALKTVTTRQRWPGLLKRVLDGLRLIATYANKNRNEADQISLNLESRENLEKFFNALEIEGHGDAATVRPGQSVESAAGNELAEDAQALTPIAQAQINADAAAASESLAPDQSTLPEERRHGYDLIRLLVNELLANIAVNEGKYPVSIGLKLIFDRLKTQLRDIDDDVAAAVDSESNDDLSELATKASEIQKQLEEIYSKIESQDVAKILENPNYVVANTSYQFPVSVRFDGRPRTEMYLTEFSEKFFKYKFTANDIKLLGRLLSVIPNGFVADQGAQGLKLLKNDVTGKKGRLMEVKTLALGSRHPRIYGCWDAELKKLWLFEFRLGELSSGEVESKYKNACN